MKCLKYLSLCFVVLSAQWSSASWYQKKCSDPTGSLTYSTGHSEEVLRAKKLDGMVIMIYPPPEEAYKFVEIDLKAVDIHLEDSKDLREESYIQCDMASDLGTFFGTQITYERVRITKTDGSEFESGFKNLSKDNKALEADLICQMDINGMGVCPKK